MASKPYNIDSLPDACCDTFGAGAGTKALSRLAGSQKLNVNIDVVPPGSHSTLYHSHTLQEEFFLILQGEGTLRTPEGHAPVRQGDFWAKPTGPEYAHTFFNSGTEPLHILDIATVQPGDVAYYPDDDVYLLRDDRISLSEAGVPENWSNLPDASATKP